MDLWRITFTGIDESCRAQDLIELWRREPRLELGVLFSDTRAGEGRYPAHRWIEAMTAELAPYALALALALHVCGGARKRFLAEEGRLPGFAALHRFGRVQLNGSFSDPEMIALQRVLDRSNAQVPALITQHDATPSLAGRVRHDGHQVLFDASGGTGMTREAWPASLPEKPCGYAGGLGPLTLERELPRIAHAAAGQPFWIDMESRLRDAADRFSLEAAHRALDVIQRASR